MTDDGPTSTDLGLTEDEVHALLLTNPLGAFVIADPLAHQLGLHDVQKLRAATGLAGRANRGQPLPIADWILLINTMRALMDPDDREWPALTGFEQEVHLAILADIEFKVQQHAQQL